MTAPTFTTVDPNETCCSPTYFDTIPAEACQNIVRNVSKRPRRQDWPRFISPHDIRTLYNCEGQLADACRTLFQSITFGNPSCCSDNSISDSKSGEIFVQGDEEFSTFKSITAQAGSSVQTLAILRVPGKPRDLPHPNRITQQCSSDEILCEGPECIRMDLEVFGPNLRALSVTLSEPEDLLAIGNSCPQLRELALFRSWIDLTPIWKACGQRLEKVYFQVRSEFLEETIASLEENCRALRSIHIAGNMDFSCFFGRLAKLYASYGEQLEHIFLPSNITDDAIVCRQIAETCPSVQIAMDSRDYQPAGMKFIGHLLRKAHVVVFSHMERDDLLHAWEYCANLSDLNVKFHCGTESDVHVLQDLCRPTLHEMEIRGAMGNIDEVFNSMAMRTGRLRKFLYEGEMPSMESLHTFVANNPALEQVDFRFFENDGGIAQTVEEDLEELMSSFSHCSALRELIIGKFPGVFKGDRMEFVADACNFLRHRQVHVRVCSVDYLA